MTRLLALLLCLTVAPAGAADQSAGKVIDRYRKASGGGQLKRIRSTLMQGRVRTASGTIGSFVYRSFFPDRLRLDIETTGAKSSECYNGKSAWRLDERGLRTLLGDEASRMRLVALIASERLADLKRRRIVASMASPNTVDGRSVDAVELARDGIKIKLLFDSMTHLLVQQQRETSAGPEQISFSDYRLVDGVQEPFAIRIQRGGEDLAISIDRVVHNAEVEQSAFRYPEVPGSRPLPDLAPLLKSITENQEKLDELREHYTCRMNETTRKLDGDGRVKEVENKVYEVTPVAGEFVERLISVNGNELSESEREKEDKRVQKEIEDLLKHKEKEKEKREREKERGEKDGEKDDDEVTISDFLRSSEITSIRREMFRGHEVIAFDFEPRKGFKPRNRRENLISKLAGTMWVDEDAKQIARLEAHLTDSFKVAGGLLASVGPSSALVFEQEKVDGELWLPSYGEVNIAVRVMLFAKWNRSFERRYSDYKKYEVSSDYNLAKPKDAKPHKD